jgi:hypothetical protein
MPRESGQHAGSTRKGMMRMGVTDLVVLLDVDNTLLDNDLLRARLEGDLEGALGPEDSARFWEVYEQVRADTDVVDLPKTIERFARECPDAASIGKVSAVVYDFPFTDHLYREGSEVIRHISSFATPVILSDGDQLFQRHKIRVSGLEEAVGGNVLVYVHKEEEVEDIRRRFPAEHYAIVDDKPRIHAAMKAAMGEELTTVMVCQGRYANDPSHNDFPEADITIEGIGGLLELTAEQLSNPSRKHKEVN